MDAIPHGCDLAGYAMTADIIAKSLVGCTEGLGWLAHCRVHEDCESSLSIATGEHLARRAAMENGGDDIPR